MEGEENKSTDKKAEFNKKTGEVGKKILQYIDKGVVLSQKGLKSAGKAISAFGDKSVQRIELSQLKKKLDKEYYSLGKFVCDKFSEFPDSEITAGDSDIKAFMDKIASISDDIKKHEDALEAEKEMSENSDENVEDTSEELSMEALEEPESVENEDLTEK